MATAVDAKRKRGRLACVACRTRKQRCDGAEPQCSYCKQHDIECVFEGASKKADVSELYVQRILNRVTQLEEELETTKASASASQQNAADGKKSASLTHPTALERQSPHLGVPAVNRDAHHNKDGSAKLRLGTASTLTFIENFLHGQQQEPRSTYTNDNSAFEYPNMSLQLHDWPQRFIADKLVDYYMEFCHPQYPFIHGPSFRTRYEMLWSTGEPLSNNFAATVNIIFALASDFSTDISTDTGQRYFQKALSLVVPSIFHVATLESLQTLILLGLYMQGTDASTQSWNVVGMAVHVAQSLELHKQATFGKIMSSVQHETRKRAWWACYLLDSVSCMQLGRPYMMSDEQITVSLPACVDDEFLSDFDKIEDIHQPPSKPSLLSFFVATIELCRFMRDVHYIYDNITDQSQCLDLDQRLCDWAANLPLHLRPTGEPSTDPKLWRQKEVLTVRFLHLRLLLHRPALIQRSPDSIIGFSPFDSAKPAGMAQILSLRADRCVAIAISLIKHMSAFYAHGINSAWWYDLNYLFSAATVLTVRSTSGLAEPQIFEMIQTAINLIKTIRDRGKVLAGNYLQILETFFQQIVPEALDHGTIAMMFQDSSDFSFENVAGPIMEQNIAEGARVWQDENKINPFLSTLSAPWGFLNEDF